MDRTKRKSAQNLLKRRRHIIKILCIVLSVFAALKMLFFGYGLDEEYQVVMSYRNAIGDTLLGSMWEPHQTSAFLCTLLMKPYLYFFHTTTGIVIYLRLWGTMIHLAISVYLYKIISGFIGEDYAFYLAMIYFNTIPKEIMLPEFGIMQVWFFTLLTLFLISYCVSGMRYSRYLILAGVAMAGEVLSYPSCVILFPFFVIVIFQRSKEKRWKNIAIFGGVCVVCGMAYLGMLLSHNTVSGLCDTVSYILNGDVTHSASVLDKLVSAGKDILQLLLMIVGICVFPLLILFFRFLYFRFGVDQEKKETSTKKRYIGKPKNLLLYVMVSAILVSCMVEVFYWVVLDAGYETMQIHLVVIAVCGFVSAFVMKSGSRSLFMDGMIGAVLSLIAVVYLTDLTLIDSLPQAMLAAFWGMILIIILLREKMQGQARPIIFLLLSVWCLTAIFGKGYALRSGVNYNNVLESGGIMKYGPGAGTISSYMGAYVYNCDYEDWQQYMQDGDTVLIVVDQVMNLDTTQYLFKNVTISHYSVVNPTAYDERLLQYWELYPDKMPNVIIVDCWYGELMTDEDSWIMNYIENDFGYTQVNDGRYIRIYRKASS